MEDRRSRFSILHLRSSILLVKNSSLLSVYLLSSRLPQACPVALTVVKKSRDGKYAGGCSNDRSWLILRYFCGYKETELFFRLVTENQYVI
jgi:hypothetical protein